MRCGKGIVSLHKLPTSRPLVSKFAVDCIEMWLTQCASRRYRNIKELLILCDNGGSNGARRRLWKYELYHALCNQYGISIRVCHYPTGASKWNPVEHRLFSFITDNWQGRPLRSFDIALECIRSTETKKGLKVEALLNKNQYHKGIKVKDSEMQNIGFIPHDQLPLWNYWIVPKGNMKNAN